MNAASLQLRGPGPARRPASASLLAGDEAAVWLAELTDQPRALTALEFYRLPGAGLLVVGADCGGMRFGWHGEHLLLPLEADLHPPVTPAEADRLFQGWRRVCWHPALGPCGFDRADALPLADLLAAPFDRRPASWNAALPGLPPPPPLRTIQFPLPPDPAAIFGEAARDIGSDPIRPDEPARKQPPKTGGSGGSGGQGGGGGSGIGGAFLQGLSSLLGGGGWIDKVDKWLDQKLKNLGMNFDRLRQQEIDGLLKQLEEDPDAGLRRAIPLGSLPGAESRGVAPPGWQLGNRSTDFRLGSLFDSRAADAWHLDQQRQEKLRQRYHELAQREIQLGRHRRAAYIFAQLLRDLPSAASTLLAGGHYREAAALYRDHLNDRRQAAQALEQGGLLEEALPLLESLQDWRGVARLHRALGDEAAARQALRREVERLVARGHRLPAAALLEQEIDAPREAAELLAAGWPGGEAAGACLQELFALFDRHGWAEDWRALLLRTRDEPLRDGQALEQVRLFRRLQAEQPQAERRAWLADAAIVRLGRHLDGATISTRRELAACLPAFVPTDRLLGRDVQRYQVAQRPPPLPRSAVSRGQWRVEVVHERSLEPSLYDLFAERLADGFVCAGQDAQGTFRARRVPWKGEPVELSWLALSVPPARTLAVSPLQHHPILLQPGQSGTEPWPDLLAFPGLKLSIGVPSWLPKDSLALAYEGPEVVVLRAVGEAGLEGILATYTTSGIVTGTSALAPWNWREPRPLLAAHVAGRRLVASGTMAWHLKRGGQAQVWSLDAPVTALRNAYQSFRPGFLVLTESEALLWWDGAEPVQVCEASPDGRLLGAFTAGNSLVLIDGSAGHIYELGPAGKPTERCRFEVQAPIAVIPGAGRDEFAVFEECGRLHEFRIVR